MATNTPRAVFVVRETEYEMMHARHATREQARFFLQSRGLTLDEIENRHRLFTDSLHLSRSSIPSDWRQTVLTRADFDRFLFGPEDFVVAVGQDGLVANVAKYLEGQPVFGVNPDPKQFDGVLVKFKPQDLAGAIGRWRDGTLGFESRTMVDVTLDDGTSLTALNEIFVGHCSHQSARYRVSIDGLEEVQSSSGLIAASGTGTTGWARSIMEATGQHYKIAPNERAIGYFVREPFPSVSTGTSIRGGVISEHDCLKISSMMNEGGTIFADGIEKDRLPFDWGRMAAISISDRQLKLAVSTTRPNTIASSPRSIRSI
jgi:NAD kinase